jgi:hypothetical protein
LLFKYTITHYKYLILEGYMKNIGMVLLAVISSFYLLNIGVGVIELIPDNIPFVGNLDEVGAVMILFMCLQHFGVDFGKKRKKDTIKDIQD